MFYFFLYSQGNAFKLDCDFKYKMEFQFAALTKSLKNRIKQKDSFKINNFIF